MDRVADIRPQAAAQRQTSSVAPNEDSIDSYGRHDSVDLSHHEVSSIEGSHEVFTGHDWRPAHRRRYRRDVSGAGHGIRHRATRVHTTATASLTSDEYVDAVDLDFEIMNTPENEIEARRMANNYLFGFRKWKSHVSLRPLENRSEVVQTLYKEPTDTRTASVCSVGNVLYVLFFGWWVALLYLVVAALMLITVVGHNHAQFCSQLALYFLWPFGKFVYKTVPHVERTPSPSETDATEQPLLQTSGETSRSGYQSLDNGRLSPYLLSRDPANMFDHKLTAYWKQPGTYVWLILGLPIIALTHILAFMLSWMPIISIPTAKLHIKALQKLLLLPPELLRIQNTSLSDDEVLGDIIMYSYRAFNVYYYKYTVDGMNVLFVNMLFFVLIAIFAGYIDDKNVYFNQTSKFVLALASVIPLAYYIGMGISSISAQSSSAVGAVLNATFGSVVEIILYITALYKGRSEQKEECYQGLVKAGLVGTLLATTLLIPGMAMVVGGLKHRSQRFNPTSAGVTATLLFVSVAAAFAPSIFAQSYALFKCDHCRAYNVSDESAGLECQSCRSDVVGVPKDDTFFHQHVLPLIYTCAALLPLAYIVGMVYSLKTHKEIVHDAFVSEVGDRGHGEGTPQWSRLKSCVILLTSVVLMSLCADIITYNIQPLLETGVSVYFVGVTLLALVPDIPEIVIGIQFALQNNIALSIEVGSCIALQTCMLQMPILVFADLIYPNGFYLLFSEIHIWTVVIGVLLNNYVFQDGKSNYFQGSALVLTYFALVAMYFFAPDPPGLKC